MISVKPLRPKKTKLNKKQKRVNITKIEKLKNPDVKLSIKVPADRSIKIKAETASNIVTEKKKAKYVFPSKSITEDVVNSCLTALQHVTVQSKKKNTIFEEETPIFIEIHCIKIQNSKGNVRFIIPNSTVASTGEVCLITPDLKKGRKIDHEPTIDKWEELLRKKDVTAVKTIIPIRQLKVEYDQFELKRRLLTQHDFIMVDTRVLSHVSHILGNMFFKKHNMLIPVRLNEEGDLKKSIDLGLHTAILRLSEGETSTIIVGHTGMSQKCLKENVLSIVNQLHTRFPGGEANIRSLSLKLPLSISVPLYLTLRPSNLITAPKFAHKRPKHSTVLEDELSTIPGAKVRVGPDGTVKLIKPKEVDSISEDEENFESTTEQRS
ncbi:hypothetical protein K1T71_007184 [Dendrolimus kikuchii]|uniref:Uncharacterized protein n=1 Tax=Dendrolimus kikuchii TaxID=765133 RepID=A0ACC1D021_9NEOP|nr:hypothetical protein K1T71_007184 [Dendrolimus kikuchii]